MQRLSLNGPSGNLRKGQLRLDLRLERQIFGIYILERLKITQKAQFSNNTRENTRE